VDSEIIPVDLDALDESYADGFESGKNWKWDYVPGGPWMFYASSPFESERSKAIALQTQAEHYAWMQGWHDGSGIKPRGL
jgi:hypothetical protein